jgi:predicted dienelactone hydrolase
MGRLFGAAFRQGARIMGAMRVAGVSSRFRGAGLSIREARRCPVSPAWRGRGLRRSMRAMTSAPTPSAHLLRPVPPRARQPLRRAAAALAALLLPALALAQVGVQRLEPADATAATTALLWYPTAATAQPLQAGPFKLHVAADAPPAAPPANAAAGAGRWPLLVVSHGTGGHELGHAWLAQGMAARGWLVLTLRHTADHYQDRSAVARADFFEQRARQLSRLLDQLLAEPRWRERIDASRIAAFGHSAGGHSVLALAGGRPDPARVVAYCSPGGEGLAVDAVMCALGGRRDEAAAATMRQTVPMDVSDPRIGAVVVAAPLVVPLQPASLKALRVPVWVEAAGSDEVLAHRQHAQRLCGQPRVRCHLDAAAGHFASFQADTGPLLADGIDPAFDPPGFDRRRWQPAALARIAAFLAEALP